MNIRSSTLRMAFFRVYRQLATAEAHAVGVNEVKDAWHTTGLRHSDLPVVLRDLIQCRLLQSMEADAAVRLNDASLHEYHERGGMLRRVEDWLTLARLGLRRNGMAVHRRRQRGRRSSDRS